MIPRSEIEGIREGLVVWRKSLSELDPGALDRLQDENLGCARERDDVEKQNESEKRLHGWLPWCASYWLTR
jgi:hypothetical protein